MQPQGLPPECRTEFARLVAKKRIETKRHESAQLLPLQMEEHQRLPKPRTTSVDQAVEIPGRGGEVGPSRHGGPQRTCWCHLLPFGAVCC